MTAEHDPIARFRDIFEHARATEVGDATAVALATVDAKGRPSSRMVLLKGLDDRGFVFYTNYESRKARELDANPRAALCFYWAWLYRQVRVEGSIERVSSDEADAYFATRPRGHQLSAWASDQSAVLPSRDTLELRYKEAETRYPGRVPRPPQWGGYRLLPESIEFWLGREDRMHERELFRRTREGWSVERLYP